MLTPESSKIAHRLMVNSPHRRKAQTISYIPQLQGARDGNFKNLGHKYLHSTRAESHVQHYQGDNLA